VPHDKSQAVHGDDLRKKLAMGIERVPRGRNREMLPLGGNPQRPTLPAILRLDATSTEKLLEEFFFRPQLHAACWLLNLNLAESTTVG
jgi:hypothetical protein